MQGYTYFSYFCSGQDIDCGISLEPPRRVSYNISSEEKAPGSLRYSFVKLIQR